MSNSAEITVGDPQSRPPPAESQALRQHLTARLADVRRATERLVASLGAEDQNLQSMPEASPAKWHRAHTTWFFETFVLEPNAADHKCFNPAFTELFNSYYNAVGRQHPRPRRALLSRPDVAEVGRYREHVDQAMEKLISGCDHECLQRIAPLIELGVNHEQQHQELLLTDLKHAFSFNPLAPRMGSGQKAGRTAPRPARFIEFDSGMVEIGATGADFCFDNETPRHQVWLPSRFALADRPVNCGDFLEFIGAGGYRDPLLWLADGWAWVQENEIEAPMYWSRLDGDWQLLTLDGPRAIDPAETICHLNFYEAQAFAEWSNARLPTEAEWESVAAPQACDGNFADSERYHPTVPGEADGEQPAAMFG
ncbi:MAG: ergothioneine biosynthesis protein EgtB, partial [Wenzhouxiangellaceae bacterium]